MKRTILFICCIFGSFFLISSNLFAQDSFDDCFEIERLKAISEGATIEESINYAKEICNLELEQQPKQDNESTAEKNANSSETPVFVLEYFGGSRTIDGVDDQPTFGILLDYYVTPKFSLAAGYLITEGEGDEVYRYDEAYTDYNDPSYRDENYDAQVPYQATETYYDEQTPYQTTENYNARVPYPATEDYDVRVAYQATENYNAQEAYYATTGTSSQLVRPSVASDGGRFPVEDSSGTITYTLLTTISGTFISFNAYYCVFKSDTGNDCYDWIKLGGYYTTYNDAYTSCLFKIVTLTGIAFRGVVFPNPDRYYCLNPQGKPSTYYSTCDLGTSARCYRWEYDNTYQKYRTVTRTRTVTKYRTETRTRTVTKYRTETRTRTVTRYRPGYRTRTVTKYRTETRTRQMLYYPEKTRSVSQVSSVRLKNSETSLGARWHILNSNKKKSSLDLFLGFGVVSVSHNRTTDYNETSYLYKEQSGSGSGSYAEAGIKYIYQVRGQSYNIGYYWRNSSASFELTGESGYNTSFVGEEKDWGGTTQGFIFGYVF